MIIIPDIMTALPILEFPVTATVLPVEKAPVNPDVDTIKATPNVESLATFTDVSDKICSLYRRFLTFVLIP